GKRSTFVFAVVETFKAPSGVIAGSRAWLHLRRPRTDVVKTGHGEKLRSSFLSGMTSRGLAGRRRQAHRAFVAHSPTKLPVEPGLRALPVLPNPGVGGRQSTAGGEGSERGDNCVVGRSPRACRSPSGKFALCNPDLNLDPRSRLVDVTLGVDPTDPVVVPAPRGLLAPAAGCFE